MLPRHPRHRAHAGLRVRATTSHRLGAARSRAPRALVLLAAAALALMGCTSRTADSASRSVTVFIGTYTRGWACDTARVDDCTSAGIYAARLDTATGVLSTPQLVAKSDNPSYLAIAPDGKHLYAVNEVGDYGGAQARTGSVSAFPSTTTARSKR